MGAFYNPQKEPARSGVRDPDMSSLRDGHVYQPSMEPDLGTGHVRCWGLTRVKARSDMFGSGTGYVRKTLLESGSWLDNFGKMT
jgi:hypothetical protein